jgi:hypothetical protein
MIEKDTHRGKLQHVKAYPSSLKSLNRPKGASIFTLLPSSNFAVQIVQQPKTNIEQV